MFDLSPQPWFSAIYLLLMVSLIECILPRTKQTGRLSGPAPPPAPRRLERLAAHPHTDVPAPPQQEEEELDAVRTVLRMHRYQGPGRRRRPAS